MAIGILGVLTISRDDAGLYSTTNARSAEFSQGQLERLSTWPRRDQRDGGHPSDPENDALNRYLLRQRHTPRRGHRAVERDSRPVGGGRLDMEPHSVEG